MASMRPPTIWAIDKSNSFPLASPPPPISTTPTARITPALLIIIVILAVVFFLSGLLHLFVRFISRPSSSRPSPAPPDPADGQIPPVDSRQLQQLFHLHDSGLDQSLIDSLPVFSYRSVSAGAWRRGEAFDCAVCLCEFGDRDRLRLLPNCGHAFHLSCIDTWLLANSTCPLCRGSMLAVDGLLGLMYDEENPDDGRPKQHGDEDDDGGQDSDASHPHHGDGVSTKVFDVKLGKFANLNGGDDDGHGESSSGYGGGSASVDGRRCFSMGSFQYVVGEPSLRVKLAVRVLPAPGRWDRPGSSGGLGGADGGIGGLDLEDMRLSRRSRWDSFSISKIWLWPRRSPLVAENGDGPCHGVGLAQC